MTLNEKHLQLRLSSKMREEIMTIADKFHMSSSDVVRGSLLFGLPVFAAMNGLQDEIISRLVVNLKRDASFRTQE